MHACMHAWWSSSTMIEWHECSLFFLRGHGKKFKILKKIEKLTFCIGTFPIAGWNKVTISTFHSTTDKIIQPHSQIKLHYRKMFEAMVQWLYPRKLFRHFHSPNDTRYIYFKPSIHFQGHIF